MKEAFDGGSEAIKKFQASMDDDIERGEKLKLQLIQDQWGGNTHPYHSPVPIPDYDVIMSNKTVQITKSSTRCRRRKVSVNINK